MPEHAQLVATLHRGGIADCRLGLIEHLRCGGSVFPRLVLVRFVLTRLAIRVGRSGGKVRVGEQPR